MKNRFMDTLVSTNERLKEKRASLIEFAANRSQLELVQKIEKEINELRLELESISDFGPENALSLRPASHDFNVNEWRNEVHRIKLELYRKQIELNIAKETYNEWFSPKSARPQQPKPVRPTSKPTTGPGNNPDVEKGVNLKKSKPSDADKTPGDQKAED